MSGPARILYIDDDAGLGRLLQKALDPRRFSVQHVETGQAGLDRLSKEPFELVALDHNLVGESGLDVLRQIRSLPSAPPVIYVTGSDDARVAVAALKAGAVDYVWKDVQGHYRELLAEAIAAALEQESLRRAKEAAEREMREARERAELLLSEVNHRVANSLSLVAALARMQAGASSSEECRLALDKMQARIVAIAALHRRLYTSTDVRAVELDTFLRSLIEELSAALNTEKGHTIELDAEPGLKLATDKAVSLGVIMSELVTNACKYAYPTGVHGRITVSLKRHGGALHLNVEDDGIGWSGVGPAQGTGVGARIIKAMAANLQSSVVYDAAHSGTRATIRLPEGDGVSA